MATVTTDPRTQIRDALAFARDARHHSECACCSYRDTSGAGHCSDRAAIWERAVDRLIDDCLQ